VAVRREKCSGRAAVNARREKDLTPEAVSYSLATFKKRARYIVFRQLRLIKFGG